jgi:hypothetical protein
MAIGPRAFTLGEAGLCRTTRTLSPLRGFDPARPRPNPALKRWAIVYRPHSGAERRERSPQPTGSRRWPGERHLFGIRAARRRCDPGRHGLPPIAFCSLRNKQSHRPENRRRLSLRDLRRFTHLRQCEFKLSRSILPHWIFCPRSILAIVPKRELGNAAPRSSASILPSVRSMMRRSGASGKCGPKRKLEGVREFRGHR